MKLNKELIVGAWAVLATIFALVQGIQAHLKKNLINVYRYSAQSTIVEEDIRELCGESSSHLIKKLRNRDLENMDRE